LFRKKNPMTDSRKLWPTTARDRVGRGSRILTLATSTSAVASDPRAPPGDLGSRFDRLPQGRIVPRLPLHPERIPVDCLSHGAARRPGFKHHGRSD
jgi:hypothetical protein